MSGALPSEAPRPARARVHDGFLWVAGGACGISVVLVMACIFLIGSQALRYFWPNPVVLTRLLDGRFFLAEVRGEDGGEVFFHLGEQDLAATGFLRLPAESLATSGAGNGSGMGTGIGSEGGIGRGRWDDRTAPGFAAVEPRVGKTVFARPESLLTPWGRFGFSSAASFSERFEAALREARVIEDKRGRLEKRLASHPGAETAADPAGTEAVSFLEREIAFLAESGKGFRLLLSRPRQVTGVMEWGRDTLLLSEVASLSFPNALSPPGKAAAAARAFFRYLTEEPREANTAGGIAPALAGTVLLILLMTVIVVPAGVAVGVFLGEYAAPGRVTRLLRVFLNALAGVPSIVFGMFGLGFYILTVGRGLDRLFFRDALPAPTFGTGGLLWSSLVLALLTVPVVVVATEEGLRSVSAQHRLSALALGATRFEVLSRIVVPGAVPGILTGILLALGRAAGEVAPLMLTGAVKHAADMPVDADFPFLHLQRQFMHLGHHLYDTSVHSPNAEAAEPLVFAAAFVLVLVILSLNLVALALRRRLRRRSEGAFEAGG